MSAAPPDTTPMMGAGEFARLSGATPGQMADLERFRERLTAGNAVMNLVGAATLPDFWSRHAWDSAQLLRIAPDAPVWADLGAGAGFPRLVLAILGKARPGFHVPLLEPLANPAPFLSAAVA